MGRIYLPPTEPVDPEETEDVESSASPSSTGRIYVSSSEPVTEVADDAAPTDDDDGKDGDSAEKPETVTVTEPAEVRPGPPPPKKATTQRGKTTS